MSDNGDTESKRSAREACISATGSMLMMAVGNPKLLDNSPPDELVDVVLRCVANIGSVVVV